ncbi:MAG: LptF/LptG family permease [Pseudomonadota bacterium]
MSQLDRYILGQVLGPFVFFVVIFGGILWLNQALRIVDVVVGNGQSGLVFAELATYLIPKVFETVVPVAAFAAAIYLTNRLYSEAELVVFMGVGVSPSAATRPFFTFGALCFLMMLTLTQLLTPWSLGLFQTRQHEISKEFLTQFVTPGTFTAPAQDVTLFFGEAAADGTLGDILINDRRSGTEVTHTAAQGQVISDGDAPKLILFDGTIQRFARDRQTLSTIQFDSLSYDLSQFARQVGERSLLTAELYPWELLGTGRGPERAAVERRIEFHDRLVKALLSIVVPALGAIVLISAGFSRSGFFLRIALGVIFMVAINATRGFVQPLAGPEAIIWPVLYVPVVIAFAVVFVLLRAGLAPWKSGLWGILAPERTSAR